MKIAGATKITRDNIDSQVFYMDWESSTLEHFDSITRHIFLPMLSVENFRGINSEKLMDLINRMMSTNQVMCGKAKVSMSVEFFLLFQLFDINTC